MTPERWQQVDRLLQAALERDPAERASFLKEASQGDEELRKEVESLLASDEGGSFLKSPALEQAAPLLDDGKSNSILGRRIGSYQITSQLGAGGMGEVYLAQDTRLGRKVALKLLPSYFTKDQQRLSRFQQEARAASGLNHPNIITIFDIGEVDSIHFIATEYIEGETLRATMHKGMKLGQVLDVAIQTASALQAAHQAGIAHRDIKPENIMLRADGYVKVLDFGLAKLAEKPGLTSDTQSATIARVETAPGTVMGTASYMSPEQARGRDVDARTDIFSLGVVLYEMIAGRVPFEGETASDVIGAILEKQPPPLARYAPDAPAEVQWIVTKALRKDKDERYQTVRELLGDLKDLKAELDAQTRRERDSGGFETLSTANRVGGLQTITNDQAVQTSTPEVARATSSAEYIITEIKRHKRVALIVMSLLVLAVAAGVFAWYRFGSHEGARSPSFQNMKLTRLTATGKATRACISPDGKYVVHVMADGGRQSLWVRQTATGSNVQIVPPSEVNCWGITFSRDGNYIYYVMREATTAIGLLLRVPVLGGTPVTLIKDVDSPITISPDSQQIAFIRWDPLQEDSGLWIANADGTSDHKLATRHDPEIFAGAPAWSPDGKTIACPMQLVESGVAYSTLFAVRVADGEQKPITSKRWAAARTDRVAWFADDGLILNAADESSALVKQLWYISYPDGQTHPITHDLNNYTDVTLTADSIALVTVQSDIQSNVWSAQGGDSNQARQLTAGKGRDGMDISWTADGKIVYDSIVSGNPDIWLMDSDGSNQKQITFDGHFDYNPVASPDGRYIVFISERTGSPHIWRMNADGSNARQLTSGNTNENTPVLTPDGRWVVYASLSEGGTFWKVSIDGGNLDQITSTARISDRVKTGGDVRLPSVAPDGQHIACWSWPDYREGSSQRHHMLGILPFAGGSEVETLEVPQTTDFAVNLQWSADGRAVFYVDTRSGVSNIWSQPLDGGPPKHLTSFKSDRIFGFAWSRDGKLALSRGNNTSDVVLIRDFK